MPCRCCSVKKIRMWVCPYCNGETIPISINELDETMKEDVLKDLKGKENPVIVKCKGCGRVWVDEL